MKPERPTRNAAGGILPVKCLMLVLLLAGTVAPPAASTRAGDPPPVKRATVNDYAPLDDPHLPNPERGIYYEWVNADDPHTLVARWLRLDGHCNKNLVWKGHADPDTSKVLKDYASELLGDRKAGRKVIFRPRYDTAKDEPNGCKRFEADTEARMRGHVDAVAAMLADFKDVVAFVQAGYLGRWGEWNWSGYKPATSPTLADPEKRRAFLAYVIKAYRGRGIDRHVGARRPVFAKQVSDQHPEMGPLVGYYNDCFMTNESDENTYKNFEGEQHPSNFATVAEAIGWVKRASADVPFGGETCPVGKRRYLNCVNMVGGQSEPAGLHMTYLNGGWAKDAKPAWQGGGCYGEIKSRLGYRFEVVSVDYPAQAAAGAPVTIGVRVRNTGWARMHNPRRAYVILKGANAKLAVGEPLAGYTALAATHTGRALVRDWLPGEEAVFEQTFAAPPGTWEVGVMLPDPERPDVTAYAVRFASTHKGSPLYDPATGVNKLGVTLVVK
ncbi:MAG TPA: DUF4832 domain-containing protein [Pyrinomonadaceae bacterium]|nr:DUF4832 domain-containing protein [Pyrinomonadaceae bacterium]